MKERREQLPLSHPQPGRSPAGIRRRSREPVSLRDVVSALNLELVQKTREPFSCEAALEPMGDTRAIVLRGASRRAPPPLHHRPRDRALRAASRPRVRPERGGFVTEAVPREEREADSFAAELLMPEHAGAPGGAGARRRRWPPRRPLPCEHQGDGVRLRRLRLAGPGLTRARRAAAGRAARPSPRRASA